MKSIIIMATVLLIALTLFLQGCAPASTTTATSPVDYKDWGAYGKVRMPDGMVCYVYHVGYKGGLSCSKEFTW